MSKDSETDIAMCCCAWFVINIFFAVSFYQTFDASDYKHVASCIFDRENVEVETMKNGKRTTSYSVYYPVSVTVKQDSGTSEWDAFAVGDTYSTSKEARLEIMNFYEEEDEDGYLPCWFKELYDKEVRLWEPGELKSSQKTTRILFYTIIFIDVVLILGIIYVYIQEDKKNRYIGYGQAVVV